MSEQLPTNLTLRQSVEAQIANGAPFVAFTCEMALALVELAEVANDVCIAQDGYLIELMDKLHKLEAV